MGAKTAKRLTTCEVCDIKFQTIQSLKSHNMAKHPGTVDQSKGTEKKTACITPISRTSKRLQQKRSIDEVNSNQTDLSQSSGDSKKIEFQCPRCAKVFPVYFSAYKHIQKRHCEDENGEPVEPDSQDLIKPIRIEICVLCCMKIDDDNHKCQKPNKSNGIYVCLGCNRKHSTVSAFDTHVSQYHCGGVKDMFFPDFNEFMKWKLNMETQVRVKYLSLSNTVTKQYYQCNYVSPKNSASVTHLCPSIITVREYLKGFEVHYYKNHYDHCCPDYEVHEYFEKYENKNYATSSFMPKDNQLYARFQSLIESITTDAGKIKPSSLRHLYAKALEMRNYLYSVDHEEHEEDQSNAELKNGLQIKNAYSLADDQAQTSVTNKSMTDDQISQALGAEAKTSEPFKRKSGNDDPMPSKKKKAGSDDDTKDKPFESPKVVLQSLSNQSPSFNDSYRQFVDTTLKETDNVTSSKKGRLRQTHIKKEIVKTKIGQFIPSPTKSLLKKESDSPLKVNKKSAQSVQSPTIATESKEPDSLLKVNKKSVQFIPSPTKSPLNKESDSLLKVKKKGKGKVITSLPLDVANIKYEVVEQENDCNILVLKF